MSHERPMHPVARMALGVAQALIIALLIGSGTLLLKLDHTMVEISSEVKALPQILSTQQDHEIRITHLEDENRSIRERMREYHPVAPRPSMDLP